MAGNLAMVPLLLIQCLILLPLFVGVLCFVLVLLFITIVISSFAIIFMRKREMVVLL